MSSLIRKAGQEFYSKNFPFDAPEEKKEMNFFRKEEIDAVLWLIVDGKLFLKEASECGER